MLYTYLFLAGYAWVVSGSVYPTQPVQATVWSADQPMLVSWVDDWKYPTLSEMGRFDIWLWRDTTTSLMRLAENVDPMAKQQTVTVPPAALRQGSTFTLRFTTDDPVRTVVYSADFGILPANTTAVAVTSGTRTGTWSATTSTTAGASASASTMMGTVPSGVPPPSSGEETQHRANAGRRVDVEKLKFRFVFVIWPVLMGITMAL